MTTNLHLQRDPEQSEVHILQNYAELANKHILEIGSGDGRLTWRYAHLAGQVTTLEPGAPAVAVAKRLRPHDLQTKVNLICSQAEQLPFSKQKFDGAIFAWSL
ncbi:MAG: class I SAM-dependent methyltransferase [Anaerolineae bacterium]|nr:class I SAM-dependent methyltransferase [Anaerolineae bacterium]